MQQVQTKLRKNYFLIAATFFTLFFLGEFQPQLSV